MKSFVKSLEAIAAIAALVAACDMTLIEKPFEPPENAPESESGPQAEPGRDLSEEERDALESAGRFLKLANLPLNTQASNVYSAQVANAASAVAQLDRDSPVRIFRGKAQAPRTCRWHAQAEGSLTRRAGSMRPSRSTWTRSPLSPWRPPTASSSILRKGGAWRTRWACPPPEAAGAAESQAAVKPRRSGGTSWKGQGAF